MTTSQLKTWYLISQRSDEVLTVEGTEVDVYNNTVVVKDHEHTVMVVPAADYHVMDEKTYEENYHEQDMG